jgi:hypothetical protein
MPGPISSSEIRRRAYMASKPLDEHTRRAEVITDSYLVQS